MSVVVNEAKERIPLAVSKLTDEPIFELTYKRSHIKEDLLFQSKDLETAIKLGNKYCTAFRFRFITVSPYIQDLNAMIAKLEGDVTT